MAELVERLQGIPATIDMLAGVCYALCSYLPDKLGVVCRQALKRIKHICMKLIGVFISRRSTVYWESARSRYQDSSLSVVPHI